MLFDVDDFDSFVIAFVMYIHLIFIHCCVVLFDVDDFDSFVITFVMYIHLDAQL